ncbi:DUF58 domain-containing protein [Candidatus Woesearchaeota archaeon]|nr:DUF58 domain-containing protein [Candidatus Woesearchaeota archaeon]
MAIKEFLAELSPKLRKTDLHPHTRILTLSLAGNLVTTFKGRGLEFEGYRQYTPQDDAARIDWKASLRSQKLLVREYDVERNYYVFFLVDVSNSMLFSSVEKLKCEYSAELVASISFAVLQLDAGVGLGLFTDKINVHVKPQMGKKQYYLITKELTNVNNYGGEFNLEESMKFLLSYLKQKTLIVIVSDFIGLKGNWFRYLEILSQRHEVIGMMIRDPRDRALPEDAGQYIVEDPYSNEKLHIDVSQYRKAYEEHVKNEERIIKNKFTITKSDFLLLTTDNPFDKPLMRFFNRRGQKWR